MGFRIPKPRIPYYTRQICSDSGFHKKKIYRRSSCVAKRSTSSWPPDRAEWNNKTTGLNGKGRFRPRLRGPDKFLKGQNLARIWPYQKYKCRSNFLTGRYGSIFTRTRVNNWTVRVIGQFARWKAGDYNSYAPLIRKSHFNADTGKKNCTDSCIQYTVTELPRFCAKSSSDQKLVLIRRIHVYKKAQMDRLEVD